MPDFARLESSTWPVPIRWSSESSDFRFGDCRLPISVEDKMANEKQEPASGDLTPIVGAATDVAPLGHIGTKPPHELTAGEDNDPVEWRRITETAEFKNMLKE